MKKIKTNLGCKDCGQLVHQWVGRCPGCGEWNTIDEVVVQKNRSLVTGPKYLRLSEIKEKKQKGFKSKYLNIDSVFGGGFFSGSVCLISGEPGIGKSSFLLQLSESLLNNNENLKVLYVTGEESLQEISNKCRRLKVQNQDLFISNEIYLEDIQAQIEELKPEILIIDSVQMISSYGIQASLGGVTQLREVTSELIKLTKSLDMISFLVGHVNKSSVVAGPKTLEHMVDIVANLGFEGERRTISITKNRFASLVSGVPIALNLEKVF